MRMLIVAILLSLCGTSDAESIPLKGVWSNGMPGTRGVGGLDAVKGPTGVTSSSNVSQITLALAARRPKQGETVGPAFVVRGTGKQTLENARDVITRFIEPGTTLPPETELTLVFYSVIGGGYLHITAVEKSDQLITVKYKYISHNTRDDSLHFALIPLGQLPKGKYEVKIEQIGSVDAKGQTAGPIEDFERFVCRSTSFRIEKEKP